ncbi:BAG family molecular chaperone regulator 6 [Punica granatum]|uniref:BAG domain-containing protein n=2 Tax=Punica granatum TaxID=22663 RepID=A0A218VV67_PUNGR|nr:BAG family molecular chaperone regulator 6 [Punica granatum]OWM64296.1 hypothetical protein CDL15_Pgr018868 [Punica granatum]PKI44990.1 hypothetical protein CRG98_034629 [Punica granatum]
MARAYACQDSIPHQNGWVQYVPYVQPTSEAVPSQVMVDPSKVPVFHGAAPYGAPYSYPVGCHSCCNHMPVPGHNSYGLSFPHFFPPQPSPWWSSYPMYPHAVPVHHVPPPPAYVADIPRYEYDKNAAGPGDYHCCGFPKHACKPQGDPRVEIEEQEPSHEKEKNSPEGGVLVPSDVRNYQYPVIWIPPEYGKNAEQKKPLKPKSADHDSALLDVKPRGKSSHQQPSWKSYLPANVENLGLQMPDGNDMRMGNQQTEDYSKQFSYPIIWIPYAKLEEGEREGKNDSSRSSSQAVPSDNYINADKIRASGAEGGIASKSGSHSAKKYAEENVLVKNAEPSAGSIHLENSGKKFGDVSDKGVENKVKGSIGKKELASPEKPKLPPVCLRVDPLPRKKSTNGSSRAPSPPGARENASSDVTDSKGKNPPAEAANERKSNQEKRKELKVIEVKDSPTGKKDGAMVSVKRAEHPVMVNSVGQENRKDREEAGEGIKEHDTVENPQKNVISDGKTEEKKETTVRPLSGIEAATLIQAAYRGFEVRKWETRKKLKQMASIRHEVAKIKKSIEELESSDSTSLDREKVAKQRVVIGETIMSLLLTLDTLQGLHPSLRDVRKSLAREMVALQEKLDSLLSKRLDDLMEKQSSAIIKGDMHKNVADDTSKQCYVDREENLQPVDAISGDNEETAAHKVKAPEIVLANAEVTIPLEGESSSETVKEFLSSDLNCEMVTPAGSIEQVSQVNTSSEEGECETMEREKDEASNAGEAKRHANQKLPRSPDSEYLVSGDGESDVDLLMELPAGVLVDQDREIVELQQKCDAPYESNQQQDHLKGEIEDIGSDDDAEVKQLETPDTQETVELEMGLVIGEEENAQKEDVNRGEVAPVTPHEVGTSAVPREETTPEQVKDGGTSDTIRGKDEEHSQEQHEADSIVLSVVPPDEGEFALSREDEQVKNEASALDSISAKEEVYPQEQHHDASTVLPESLAEEGESNLSSEDTTAPEQVKDENASSVLSPEGLQKLVERNDSNAGEPSGNQENEIGVEHEQGDRCGAERVTAEEVMENVRVAKPPENEVVVVTEDHPVYYGDGMASSGSKLSNSNSINELEHNEKLREMMQKLMEAGKEQLDVISSLTGRMKELEKKLAKSKKMRSRRCRAAAASRRKLSPNPSGRTPLST